MKKLFAVLILVVAFSTCRDRTGPYSPSPEIPNLGEQIQSIKIGQRIMISRFEEILRVPGGWLYRLKRDYGGGVCFIPYSTEK